MVLIVRGKGDRERIIPAHPLVVAAVAAWPRSGRARRADGRPHTANDVSWRTRAFLHGLGIDASAHQLRHWFGTRTYAESRDLRVVQELMGHASPDTTAVYTAWSRPAAVDAVVALEVPAA
jgi:integrase